MGWHQLFLMKFNRFALEFKWMKSEEFSLGSIQLPKRFNFHRIQTPPQFIRIHKLSPHQFSSSYSFFTLFHFYMFVWWVGRINANSNHCQVIVYFFLYIHSYQCACFHFLYISFSSNWRTIIIKANIWRLLKKRKKRVNLIRLFSNRKKF